MMMSRAKSGKFSRGATLPNAPSTAHGARRAAATELRLPVLVDVVPERVVHVRDSNLLPHWEDVLPEFHLGGRYHAALARPFDYHEHVSGFGARVAQVLHARLGLWGEFTIPEARRGLGVRQAEWSPQAADASDALDSILHIRCLLVGVRPVSLGVGMAVAKTPQEELARCRRQCLPRTLRRILPRLVLAAIMHRRHSSVLKDLGNLARVEHVFVVGVHLHPRRVTAH